MHACTSVMASVPNLFADRRGAAALNFAPGRCQREHLVMHAVEHKCVRRHGRRLMCTNVKTVARVRMHVERGLAIAIFVHVWTLDDVVTHFFSMIYSHLPHPLPVTIQPPCCAASQGYITKPSLK